MMIEESYDVLTGRLAAASLIEDRGYLAKGQTGQLGVLDESESVDRLGSVSSVPVGGAFGLLQHPYLLVVANRLGRYAGETAEFSDVHGPQDTCLDLPATGTCTFGLSAGTSR